MTAKQFPGSGTAPDGSQYVTLTDGNGTLSPASGGTVSENLTQVGGAAIALGQTTKSASLPITIASDQGNLTVNQGTAAALSSGWPVIGAEIASDTTGTFTNGTQTTSVTATSLDGYGTALVSINGTYGTATAVFETSDDGGTTWYAVLASQAGAAVTETGYTSLTNTTRNWLVPISGSDQFRVRSTAVASGTVNIRISISSAVPPSSTVVSGTIAATQSGSWTVSETSSTNTFRLLSAAGASGDANNVKNAAGTLFAIQGANVATSARYLKLYNASSAPTAGSGTPVKTLYLPASSAFTFDFHRGYVFSTGIGFTLVTGSADNNSTSVTAGDILALNLDYA